MRIFISQPMGGLSDEEVLRNKDCAIKELLMNHDYYYLPDHFEVIDSWLGHCNKGPIWCLGESIKLMQEADRVVFLPGWRNARGCRIEHQVCEDYGIRIMEI